MAPVRNWRIGLCLLVFATTSFAAAEVRADEIRLKDGKKLYGVIVGYDDNMFKIKTDFGFVLVEKDKIAQIIPTGGNDATAASKPAPRPAVKTPVAPAREKTEAATAPAPLPAKREMITNANIRPTIPAPKSVSMEAAAPAIKTAPSAAKANLTADASVPAAPQELAPVSPEEIQGNLYINHAYGFHMYKAPSWQIIEDAGNSLPNAIVAMGTTSESTLLVVGHEKTKAALEAAAVAVEKRVREVYDNFRLISEKKTVIGGQPAIEYHFRGMADQHDWSGTLVVVSRSGELFTILGMTFADTDLIQIQENVIARSIASVDFGGK
jgi:hypothetical protein